ncbi:MAG: hypothetical protein M0Q90_12240 [Bacteroidales bacterium]|nr:hypothetical protein [Bacteroidales bacterium]
MKRFGINILAINKLILLPLLFLFSCNLQQPTSITMIDIVGQDDSLLVDTLYSINKKSGTIRLIYHLDSLLLNSDSDTIKFETYNLSKDKAINDTVVKYLLNHNLLNISAYIFFLKHKGLVYYKSHERNTEYKILEVKKFDKKGVVNIEDYRITLKLIDSLNLLLKGEPPILNNIEKIDSIEIDFPY